MINLTATSLFGYSGQYIARIDGRDEKYTFNRIFIGRKSGKRNESSEVDVDEEGIYECCDVTKNGKSSRYYFIVDVNGILIKFIAPKENVMNVAKTMDSGKDFCDIVIGIKCDAEAYLLNEQFKFLKNLLIVEGSTDWIGRMEKPIVLTKNIGSLYEGMMVDQSTLQPVLKVEMQKISDKLEALSLENKFPNNCYEILKIKEIEKKKSDQTISSALNNCWNILQPLPAKEAKKILSELKKRLNPKEEM